MQAGGKYPSNEDGRVYFFFPKMGYPSGNFHEVGGRDKEVKITCFPYTTLKLNLLYFQFEPQPLQINDYCMINLAIFFKLCAL